MWQGLGCPPGNWCHRVWLSLISAHLAPSCSGPAAQVSISERLECRGRGQHKGETPPVAPLLRACQASRLLLGRVLLAPPGRNAQVSGLGLNHTSTYSRTHTYLTDQRRDGPFLIPDVIITSVPASSESPHTPGMTPNAMSHLPTPAAPSSESHTYLSQTTRPTPTGPHITNRPQPANNYSHSCPHPCGPNSSCC